MFCYGSVGYSHTNTLWHNLEIVDHINANNMAELGCWVPFFVILGKVNFVN